MEENLEVKFGRDINCLREKDKNVRINSLKRLDQSLFKEPPGSLAGFFAVKLKAPLLDLLKDPADKCKELTVAILSKLVKLEGILNEDVAAVIKALHGRLGVEPVQETCEEVRIAEMDLLALLIEKFMPCVQPIISDVTDIYARLGKDKCPAVKNQVAAGIIYIAKHGLRFGSKKLLDSVKANAGHQQFKVRCLALEAMGALSLHDSGVAEELFPEFKKSQVDRRMEVRLQTYALIHEILMHLNYVDLVKIEGKFVYLLLGGLADEECAEKIKNWLLQINSRVFKTWQEYESSDEEFGESWLVVRNVKSLVEICIADIQEWTIQDFYRSRAVNVLKHIASLARRAILPYLNSVLKVLFSAYSGSNDPKYQELIEQVFFILPSVLDLPSIIDSYSQILIETLTLGEKLSGLKLLSAVIHGAAKDQASLTQLVDFLFVKDFSSDYSLHAALIFPVTSIITSFQSDCKAFMNELFYILLTLENTLKDQASEPVFLLSSYSGYSDVSELYSLELPYTLPKIISNYKNWDSQSYERKQFRNLVVRAGPGVQDFWTTVLDVIQENCGRDKDNEVRYDMLAAFEAFTNCSHLQSRLYEDNDVVIGKIITPTALWRVGISSVQIRISSLVCLNTLIKNHTINIKTFATLWENFFTAFHGCLDDDWDSELRLAALQCVKSFADELIEELEGKMLEGFLKETIKRLDDSVNVIRVLATKPLEIIIRKVAEKGISVDGIDKMIRVFILHLDDECAELRQGVLLVLVAVAEGWKELVLDIVKEKRDKQRNVELLDELIKRIES